MSGAQTCRARVQPVSLVVVSLWLFRGWKQGGLAGKCCRCISGRGGGGWWVARRKWGGGWWMVGRGGGGGGGGQRSRGVEGHRG